MILELIFFVVAVVCYTVSQAILHGKFNLYGGQFWDDSGWLKYANPLDEPKDNWYYKFFKIGYKERFPLSATLFVFVTDAYHLFQALFKIFLCLSFAPQIGLIWAGILWVVWGITFTIVYRYAQR